MFCFCFLFIKCCDSYFFFFSVYFFKLFFSDVFWSSLRVYKGETVLLYYIGIATVTTTTINTIIITTIVITTITTTQQHYHSPPHNTTHHHSSSPLTTITTTHHQHHHPGRTLTAQHMKVVLLSVYLYSVFWAVLPLVSLKKAYEVEPFGTSCTFHWATDEKGKSTFYSFLHFLLSLLFANLHSS